MWDFLGGVVVKNLSVSAGDIRYMGSIPGSGTSHGGGNGNPVSLPENSTDRGAYQAIVHRVALSWT